MLGVFGGFYHYMFDSVQRNDIILMTLISFIFQTLPSVLPVAINIAYTFMLAKLKAKNINGLKQEKTTESSRLEVMF